MNADQLLAHYEQVADAPDAISRLRRFILDLAVRGKLMEQNANDEPTSELLKRIEVERKERVARGEIKRAKPLNSITRAPFDPPSDWTWLPLGETGNIFTGNSINAATREQLEKTVEGRPFIATKDVGYGFDEIDYTNGLLVELSDERFKIARSDSVLICAEGGSAGRKIALTDREISFGNKLLANETWGVISPKFVLCVYLSDFFYAQFAEKMTGVIGGISLRNFLQLPFPLPPLAEQHRIVAKFDELMELCDGLEAARAEREATRDRLTAASLVRLDAPDPDPAIFRVHAAFALENLVPLTARPDQIKVLRQTILNLAVRGKLAAQDPKDEPVVSNMLGLYDLPPNTRKLLNPLDPSDCGGDLPKTWSWMPLGAIIRGMDAGWSPQCENHPRSNEEEWGILKTTAVQALAFDAIQHKKLPEKLEPRPQYQAEIGDILVTRAGPKNRVGVSCVVDVPCPKLMISDKLIRFHAIGELSARYIALTLNAGYTFDQIEAAKSGMAVMQMNISQNKLRAIPIPLPPLAEQRRIVAKVDELMALCDRLEAALTNADDTRQRLLEALLHEALVPGEEREEAA